VLAALDRAASEADALGRQMIFLVGEGSQIPFSPDTASLQRNLRFLVTRGSGPGGPDVLLSSFHPDEGDVELMAWDRRSGGFNFYRTVGANSGWVFAGNSRHALADPTQGKGPFESHRSGNILMKELRAPLDPLGLTRREGPLVGLCRERPAAGAFLVQGQGAAGGVHL
jgi:hypothetical protein